MAQPACSPVILRCRPAHAYARGLPAGLGLAAADWAEGGSDWAAEGTEGAEDWAAALGVAGSEEAEAGWVAEGTEGAAGWAGAG